MVNGDLKRCCICGLPRSAIALAWLNWRTDRIEGGAISLRMYAQPFEAAPGSVPVCTECIRQIKRLPFSEVIDAEVPF
jgi:hypothetical protein